MPEWIAVLAGKLGLVSFGMGAVVTILLSLARKKVPHFFGDFFASKLEKQLRNIDSIKDPALRKLVFAWAVDTVKIAEYLMPEKGSGSLKFKFAADLLCKTFPFLSGRQDVLVDLIEESVQAMKDELGKVGQ